MTLEQAQNLQREMQPKTAHFIKAGFGYWNTTRYPYGGDFRRPSTDTPIAEMIEDLGPRYGWKVRLENGDTAVVSHNAIG